MRRPLSSPRGGGLSSPPENGRGGGPPFSQALIVPEHIVWGSLVGSARKAHGGRASGGGQGASSAGRRSQALAGGRPWGVPILAPVRRRVETGPGREARGGRRVTWRCLSVGAAVPGEARWLWPTGRTPSSESQYAA